MANTTGKKHGGLTKFTLFSERINHDVKNLFF